MPAADAIVTTCPRSRASIAGRNARVVQKSASAFTSNVRWMSSSVASRSFFPDTMPALLTRMSTGPRSASVFAATVAIARRSARLQT
jgi:hypothetical protein